MYGQNPRVFTTAAPEVLRLAHGQTVVIGNRDPDFHTVPQRLRENQLLVDFVRISEKRSENGQYNGICW